MVRTRHVLVAVAATAAFLAACGSSSPAPTTAAAATTTTAAQTTTKATTTAGVILPDKLGSYSKINSPGIDTKQLVAAFPFDPGQGDAAVYGDPVSTRPAYIVVAGGGSKIASASQSDIQDEVLKALGSGGSINQSSKVQTKEGDATISCAAGTQQGLEFAYCLAQEDAGLGIVFSVPGVGPTDVPSAQALTRALVSS